MAVWPIKRWKIILWELHALGSDCRGLSGDFKSNETEFIAP